MTINNRILSFDIETSSLEPRNGFVWQSGFASYENDTIKKEGNFFDPQSAENRETALRSSVFGEKQFKAGAFAEYLASSGNKNQEQFITSVVDKIIEGHKNGKDILLIQNANFERRWLESIAENSDFAANEFKRLNGIMSHSYSVNNVPSFHPSPKILELRNTALGNYYDFLKTGNMQGFDIAASTYNDIMSEYKSYFTSSKDILKPMDMMDITRGLLFRLAENGHIEKNMSLIGTSQSFLSSIFLDRPEKHLAPDDAGDALEIFTKHLFSMYDEVTSGNISDSSKMFIAKLKDGHSKEARKQFIKSMIRAVDEGSSDYGYSYAGKIGTESNSQIEFVNNKTGAKETANRSFRNGLFTLKVEDNLDLILSDVAERYTGIAFDEHNAQIILNDIMQKSSNKEKIEYLNSLDELDSIDIKNQDIDSGKIWSYIKQNKIKSIVGIGAAIGMSGVLMSNNTDNSRMARQNYEANNSLERGLKMYNTIPQYHGSGFADWNERTKHHYY